MNGLNKTSWVLLIALVMVALLSTPSRAWGFPSFPDVGKQLSDGAKQAGGVISDGAKQAGKHISDLNPFKQNINPVIQQAINDIRAELQRLPQNINANARAVAEQDMKRFVDDLQRNIPVQPDVIKQQAIATLGRLLAGPAYDAARIAMIAKNIADVADEFRLANENANSLVDKAQGWPTNNENLSIYCSGLRDNSNKVFAPFVEGNEALIMNIQASVNKIRDPLMGAVNRICQAVDEAQQQVNARLPTANDLAESLKKTIRDEMVNQFRDRFKDALPDIIAAAAVPF